jgi:large subunit ribosomal protein L4
LLVVLDRDEEVVWKSLRNLGARIQIVLPEELNTYDVLVSDRVVFSRATLDATVARLGSADSVASTATTASNDGADDGATDDGSEA